MAVPFFLCHPQSDRPDLFLFFSDTMSDFVVVVVAAGFVVVRVTQIGLDAGALGTGTAFANECCMHVM